MPARGKHPTIFFAHRLAERRKPTFRDTLLDRPAAERIPGARDARRGPSRGSTADGGTEGIRSGSSEATLQVPTTARPARRPMPEPSVMQYALTEVLRVAVTRTFSGPGRRSRARFPTECPKTKPDNVARTPLSHERRLELTVLRLLGDGARLRSPLDRRRARVASVPSGFWATTWKRYASFAWSMERAHSTVRAVVPTAWAGQVLCTLLSVPQWNTPVVADPFGSTCARSVSSCTATRAGGQQAGFRRADGRAGDVPAGGQRDGENEDGCERSLPSVPVGEVALPQLLPHHRPCCTAWGDRHAVLSRPVRFPGEWCTLCLNGCSLPHRPCGAAPLHASPR